MVEKGHSAETAGQVLLASYPDDREREHAARWLGWIAYHMGGRRSFGAGSISGWVAQERLGLAGFLRMLPALCCVAGCAAGGLYGLLVLPGSWKPVELVALCVTSLFLSLWLPKLWLGELARLGLHRRRIRFGPLLADAVDRGVLRRTGSAYTFVPPSAYTFVPPSAYTSDPATAAALAAPYHARDAVRARRAADKAREQAALAARPGARAALIAFLTEGRRKRLIVDFGVGAAVLAFPVYPSLFNPPGGWLTIVGQFAALAAGMGACGAVVAWAALPLLRRLSGWSPQNVPDLSRRGLLFAVALTLAAGALIFPALPRATPDVHGPNWTVLGLLVVAVIWTEVGGALALIRRVCPERRFPLLVATAAASALAFLIFPFVVHGLPDTWLIIVCQFALAAEGLCVNGAAVVAWPALALLRRLSGWSLRNVHMSRRGRLVALVVAAAAAAELVAAAGTGLADTVAFTLPAACVAACGLWAGILAARKVRGKARWLRLLPDAIGAVTTAATLLALTEHNLLTAVPATGLLFPVAIWGSIRIWLAMKSSDRVSSRAGADVTLSLLLGAVLVLFLVWLANLFGMSRPEIDALRAVLDHVGAVADVPWWAWVTVYLVLAAVSLGIVLRPARMATIRRWQQRLRVVSVTEVLRRTLIGAHIGLLTIVFIGAGASAALPSAFQHELAVAYTVAFQRQLQAEGEHDAYGEILLQLTASSHQGTLTQVVAAIHHDDPPPPGDDDATSSEEELAQRVGVLQAATLGLSNTRQAVAPAEAEARARGAGMDAPLRDKTDLTSRLAETRDEEQSRDQTEENAHQFGEAAAKLVASTIGIAGVGSNEVLQVVREYLSGLVEDSGVADTFAASAQGRRGVTPPEAAALVEPDPAKLEQAAQQELEQAYKAAGNPGGLNDDPSYLEQDSIPPLETAVDMTNQSMQVAGGSCCVAPGEDDQPPEEGGE